MRVLSDEQTFDFDARRTRRRGAVPAPRVLRTGTGRLEGTPGSGNVGKFGDIGISMTDGIATTRLAPRSLAANASGAIANVRWLQPRNELDEPRHCVRPAENESREQDNP